MGWTLLISQTLKSTTTGHLLQVGGTYLVNFSFHTSYTIYAQDGELYLNSKKFRMMYPDISNKQARLDRTYLYIMLVSSNIKDVERKFILKNEASHNGMMA